METCSTSWRKPLVIKTINPLVIQGIIRMSTSSNYVLIRTRKLLVIRMMIQVRKPLVIRMIIRMAQLDVWNDDNIDIYSRSD